MSHISLKSGAITLPKFVKRLGYESAQNREFNVIRRMLEKQGIIEIQQSGYAGHSLAHPKLVVIRQTAEFENFERINANLRVNFNLGYFTVHRATKPFQCSNCKEDIWSGERYGSRVQFGRRRSRRGPRRIIKYTVLCLPCLTVRYDEFLI
jgi:hypothetical protein